MCVSVSVSVLCMCCVCLCACVRVCVVRVLCVWGGGRLQMLTGAYTHAYLVLQFFDALVLLVDHLLHNVRKDAHKGEVR